MPGGDHQMSIERIEFQMNHVNRAQATLPVGALHLPATKAFIRLSKRGRDGKPDIRMGQGGRIAPHRQPAFTQLQTGSHEFRATVPFSISHIQCDLERAGFTINPARSTRSLRSAMSCFSDVSIAPPAAISAKDVMGVGMGQVAILSGRDDRLLATGQLTECNAVAICTAGRRMIAHLPGGDWSFILPVSNGNGKFEDRATMKELLKVIIQEAFTDSHLSSHRPRIILAYGARNIGHALDLRHSLTCLGEMPSLPQDWLSRTEVVTLYKTSSLVLDAQGNFIGSEGSVRAFSN